MNDNFKPVVIWMALVNSTLLYVAIAWMAVSPRSTVPFVEALRQRPVPLLYALAVVMFIASLVVPDKLRRPPDRSTAAPKPEARSATLTVLLVRWAMTESVAIFGLVAAFTARVPLLVLPPFLLALAGFAMSYPSPRRLDEMEGRLG